MSTTHVIENNKLLIRRLYENCINRGNLALLTELIADDFVGSPGAQGAAEFAKGIATIRYGFPDVQFEVEDLIAEGDRVAVRWSFRGTHGGPFAGRAASHAQVTQTANVIFQIRDGKIARAWVQVDRLGLLQQIGALAA
ncbi:conserved hypothetical protein, steroid delta-isomerase-related [Collimonas sp. OK307]|uniref:ester cyclase n=1 Tax=Collimonas sp. OK307 TaxID=1801620 RepID=UPI0008E72227|nr:ester cyclase [Collimonas sp. OK307]SFH71909.1 conserved hypothetical protein, steroid delta-isomerase-related [Collimonas sp. OK307]